MATARLVVGARHLLLPLPLTDDVRRQKLDIAVQRIHGFVVADFGVKVVGAADAPNNVVARKAGAQRHMRVGERVARDRDGRTGRRRLLLSRLLRRRLLRPLR